MNKIHAAITAVHGYVPDDVLTNKDLEAMVDTTDEWIISRTGIKERRILKGEGLGTSDMAVHAVNGLLKKRGITAEEIELIIFCTTTPDMPFPASANILADKIGAKNAWGYDLQAACSGFIFGLATGASFVESGRGVILKSGGIAASSLLFFAQKLSKSTGLVYCDLISCGFIPKALRMVSS